MDHFPVKVTCQVLGTTLSQVSLQHEPFITSQAPNSSKYSKGHPLKLSPWPGSSEHEGSIVHKLGMGQRPRPEDGDAGVAPEMDRGAEQTYLRVQADHTGVPPKVKPPWRKGYLPGKPHGLRAPTDANLSLLAMAR